MKQHKKDARIYIRTSKELQDNINKQAQKLNVSASSYIRTLVQSDLSKVEQNRK